MITPKTYWHLESLKRKPTDYEIATSRLLYHPQHGFEVNVPVADWYRQYQKGSPLVCSDWEKFQDPRETTYTTYTIQQSAKEIFVGRFLRTIEDTGHDRNLSPEWTKIMEQVLPPLRYPVHGLQMVASYIGQMAPAGRIAIVAMFQAGDEIRRVQRLAYRMRQLQDIYPDFGADSRVAWENAAMWQPMREVIEKLLVTYDWGEAFTALNLVLKPAFDELFMVYFGQLASAFNDDPLHKIFQSLNEDCVWHRQWSRALVTTALQDTPGNREVVEGWIGKWTPSVTKAIEAFAPLFNKMLATSADCDFSSVMKKIEADSRGYLQQTLAGSSDARPSQVA